MIGTERSGTLHARGALKSLWSSPGLLLWFPPLFWAINLIIGRAYATEFPPFSLTLGRWLVALGCLLPFVWRELYATRSLLFSHWRLICVTGIVGFAGYPALNYVALHSVPAATASFLNSTLPLIVPLFAWVTAREPLTWGTGIGVLTSLLGVAVIVSHGRPTTLVALSIGTGECLVLLAVSCYALYSVLLRYVPKSLPPLVFLCACIIPTIIAVAPLALWEASRHQVIHLVWRNVLIILFVGIFPSLIAALIWNRCVALIGSAITGASFHLVAIYSTLLAFFLLHEPIHRYQVLGAILILTGFAIATLARSRC